VIGARENQAVVSAKLSSENKGFYLEGEITYAGEGPIGFKGDIHGDNGGNNYYVTNQWGGSHAPWHEGGIWVLGTREHQHVVDLDIHSSDEGKSYTGTMTYYGEGPIGFRAKKI